MQKFSIFKFNEKLHLVHLYISFDSIMCRRTAHSLKFSPLRLLLVSRYLMYIYIYIFDELHVLFEYGFIFSSIVWLPVSSPTDEIQQQQPKKSAHKHTKCWAKKLKKTRTTNDTTRETIKTRQQTNSFYMAKSHWILYLTIYSLHTDFSLIWNWRIDWFWTKRQTKADHET